MELMAEQRISFNNIEDMLEYQKAMLNTFKNYKGMGIEIIVPVYIREPSLKIRLYKNIDINSAWIKTRDLSLN